MNDQSNQPDKIKKERSPSFPFIPLERAVARAKEIAVNHKRAEARLVVVAQSWGYGEKSSGLLQTASALKQFGLIDELGSGADRKIKLSELAWRILVDTRTGAKEQALREAATKPRLIAECIEKWSVFRPSESHCLSELQLDRGFTPTAAKVFLKVFDETISFANLREDDTLSSNPKDTLDAETSPGKQPMDVVSPPAPDPVSPPPGQVYQIWHVPGHIKGSFDITDTGGADELIRAINAWKVLFRPVGAAVAPKNQADDDGPG